MCAGAPLHYGRTLSNKTAHVAKVSELGCRHRSKDGRSRAIVSVFVSLNINRRINSQIVMFCVVQAPVAAPAAPAKLSEKQLQLLQQYEGPLVKIATHYHVGFGDCLKVVGSCDEFGAWNADQAPLMKWGEGDVWSLVVPLPPGDHEFKVSCHSSRADPTGSSLREESCLSPRQTASLQVVPFQAECTVPGFCAHALPSNRPSCLLLSLPHVLNPPALSFLFLPFDANMIPTNNRSSSSRPAATWSGRQETSTASYQSQTTPPSAACSPRSAPSTSSTAAQSPSSSL
jgi:hypothetical protein